MTKEQPLHYASSFHELVNKQTRPVDIPSLTQKMRRAIIMEDEPGEKDGLFAEITGCYRSCVPIDLHKLAESVSLLDEIKKSPFFTAAPVQETAVVFRGIQQVTNARRMHELREFADAFPEHAIFISGTRQFIASDSALQQLQRFVYVDYSDQKPPHTEKAAAATTDKSGLRKKAVKQTKQAVPDNSTDPTLAERMNAFTGAVYAVGTMLNKVDRMEHFLQTRTWDPSGSANVEEAINAVRQGDILVAKSSTQISPGKVIRIKYLGKVIRNPGNGNSLEVHWIMSVDKNLEGALARLFRLRISPMGQQHLLEIVSQLPTAKQRQLAASSLFDNVAPPDAPKKNGYYSTTIACDCIDPNDVDTLGFTRDAQSLAALIALKDMQPPLAIALFGRWGSGKSFFMQLMEKYIRELSFYQGFLEAEEAGDRKHKAEVDLFYRGIAHIRFNAWSYMDANLWAGLSSSLFEKLNEYITNNTKSAVEKLKIQVKVTKRLDVLHSNMKQYKEKHNQLLHLKERLEQEREQTNSTYKKIQRYDKIVTRFLKQNGLSKEEVQSLTPSDLYQEIENHAGLWHYVKAKWYLFVALICVVVVVWLLAGDAITAKLADIGFAVNKFVSGAVASIIAVATTVSRFLISARSALQKAKAWVSLPEPEPGTTIGERIFTLKNELEDIDNTTRELQSTIDHESSKSSNITQLAIASFISSKAGQEEYSKHLGIITTIRKDFETLSELFVEQNKAKPVENDPTKSDKENKKKEDLEKDKRAIQNSFETDRKLDRIVLYIDDLDRCTDEKIMEVLEAIHLLMAFPLFTVVVGVDERSVYNALINRKLSRYRGVESAIVDRYIKAIDPHEYLEKIFQIPFQLPEADEKGISDFIDHLIPVTRNGTIKELSPRAARENVKAVLEADRQMNKAKRKGSRVGSEDDFAALTRQVMPEKEVKLTPVVPQSVEILSTEKLLLTDFAPLVGTNPRALKRYINIFRITKVHDYIRAADEEKMQKIIFLIALTMGEFDAVGHEWLKSGTRSLLACARESNNRALQLLLSELSAKGTIPYGQLFTEPSDSFVQEMQFIRRFSYTMRNERFSENDVKVTKTAPDVNQ